MTDRDKLIEEALRDPYSIGGRGSNLEHKLARALQDDEERINRLLAEADESDRALQDCERERERLFAETEGPAGLREQAADLRLEIKFREAAEQRVEELERVLSQIAGGFISPSKGERRLRDVAKAALAASPPPEEQDG